MYRLALHTVVIGLIAVLIGSNTVNADDKVIRYSNDFIELYLPLGWKMSRAPTEEDPTIFSSADGEYSLTISYMFYDNDRETEVLDSLFTEYFNIRVATERSFSSDTSKLLVGALATDHESIWQTFAGVDEINRRRFNGLVVAENGSLITFYLESMRQSAEHHNHLVHEIFGSIDIK